jgi:hypothetical protein
VLLMSGVASQDAFHLALAERLLETAIGAGLALVYGVAVPSGSRRLAHSRAAVAGSPGTEA